MSDMRKVGVINQEHYHKIEWTIKDIYSYGEVDQKLIHSPRFSVPGSKWYLKLKICGTLRTDSPLGFVCIYLVKDESTSPKDVIFGLGMKWQDENIQMIRSDVSYVFSDANKEYGVLSNYLKICPLPNVTLTVICLFREKDALDTTLKLFKLSDDFKKMFLREDGCDTTLKVHNQHFSVNRSVLASRSSVFNAMFETDMSEKTSGVVDIVDCHPGAFKDFLTYIYSGQFEYSSGDLFELYKIAHKYDVEELKASCVQSIRSTLSVENVIDVAVFANEFDDDELERESQKIFDENFSSIISQDKWLSLLKNNYIFANELLGNMAKTMKVAEKVPTY